MANASSLASGLATLAEILERDKNRGTDTLAIESETLEKLHQLPALLRAPKPVPGNAEPQRGSTEAAPAPLAQSIPSAIPRPDEAARRAALKSIYIQVCEASEPRELDSLFDTVVFARGHPLAELMFVGEAPGAEEEKLKKPFVGPAGKKLDQILQAMKLAREQFYISNIVKFRPKIGDGRLQGSRNRPPTDVEMAACLPFIRAEIEVLQPKVIVALGRTAAEGLLQRSEPISSFRKSVHAFENIPVVVTYHPSFLLRQEAASPEEGTKAKRQVWEDMLSVMELAGLPITEKQRGFFL